jgi:hypothetical protein
LSACKECSEDVVVVVNGGFGRIGVVAGSVAVEASVGDEIGATAVEVAERTVFQASAEGSDAGAAVVVGEDTDDHIVDRCSRDEQVLMLASTG